MRGARPWGRLRTWWCLYGQFSRPVRLVRPSRRRAHAAVRARYADPGFLDESLHRLTLRIKVVSLPHSSGPPALTPPPEGCCTCGAGVVVAASAPQA
ncbi:hypothetical protein ACSNOH_18845 [Streptomyces sp. URMC 127]|uniref:hypothetical protein n=1 Tax=Streptomyces sp. URMC 127 TaxID=3423402 RepID=UPI003F1B4B2C